MRTVAQGIPAATIEAARSGDRDALLTLLSAVQPDLRRYARTACRTSSDIDDAVQEALWLLYRRIGTLRAVTAFSGWLFAIVRRECLRLARKTMSIAPFDDETRTDALLLMPDAALRSELASAIQSLPAHYRDVVILRDIDELTIDEIAARLSVTRESAKARLHRARTLLREYLVR